MAEQRNPLREWREKRGDSVGAVAVMLGYGLFFYAQIEADPASVRLTTDIILRIQSVTQIPLPVLVDWLTETTKEMA